MAVLNLSRVVYVLARVVTDLCNLTSRAINALLFGGSTAQSLSARAHMEAPTNPVWERRRRFLNAVFFYELDHCAASWHLEVERARHVLSRLEPDHEP
jgi:hypothetical protein